MPHPRILHHPRSPALLLPYMRVEGHHSRSRRADEEVRRIRRLYRTVERETRRIHHHHTFEERGHVVHIVFDRRLGRHRSETFRMA